MKKRRNFKRKSKQHMDMNDANSPTNKKTNPSWLGFVSTVIVGIVTHVIVNTVSPLVVGIIFKYAGPNAFSSVVTIVMQWSHHFFRSTRIKETKANDRREAVINIIEIGVFVRDAKSNANS